MSSLRRYICTAAWAGAAWVGGTMPAGAMEPLAAYLEAGRQNAAETTQARAERGVTESETKAARASLFPSLEARGAYTRNQYEIVARIPRPDGSLQEAVITPKNQLEASVTLAVPLVDVPAIRRLQAADARERVAGYQADATRIALERRISRAYTRVVAYEALAAAGRGSLEAAEANATVVRERSSAGLASELDVSRAMAAVESARQALEEAAFERRSAARELEALTGLPVSGPVPALPDEVGAELELSQWLDGIEPSTEARLARARLRAARSEHRAARAEFWPRLQATASERITNAPAFGEEAQWSVGVTLSAKFDVGAVHRARAQRARASASEAGLELALRDKRLQIQDAHDRVDSLRARTRAAQAEASAARAAVLVAQSRYRGGTATQLEVVQALRDEFTAAASEIQARAELRFARIELRLAAERPLEDLP